MRVLVTGAARGIGRALVEALVARGDHVVATVRREGELAHGPRLEVLVMDVTDETSVRAARARCAGPLDLLFSNAGLSGGPQRAPGMDLARAANILDVNALGALRVYDAFVDLLREAKAPWLVQFSSEAASLGAFRASSKPEYAMSKAAVNALTRWIAATEPHVRVVSLHPGWTRTAMGGEGAPRSAAETAGAVLRAVERLGPEHHGAFVDTDLAPIPW